MLNLMTASHDEASLIKSSFKTTSYCIYLPASFGDSAKVHMPLALLGRRLKLLTSYLRDHLLHVSTNTLEHPPSRQSFRFVHSL